MATRARGETQSPAGANGYRGSRRAVAAADVEPAVRRLVAIDWSGRVDASGQRRHIWAGIWTCLPGRPVTVRLENGRTREETGDWLIALARETPAMAVSIDCCFSYPAWFLREHGCATVFDFWRRVSEGQGERWLARETPGLVSAAGRDSRFWGKPHKRPEVFSGANLRTMFRHTDFDNKFAQALEGGDAARAAKMKGITPKSPFQIGGSGSVGTGSLRAMPVLARLHAAGFRVWPFEDAALPPAAARGEPRPLLVEMYTRLMTGPVAKSNAVARKAYLKRRLAEDPVYAPVGRAVLRKAEGSEDAFDALVSTLEMVRYAGEFARLRATPDPYLRLEGITWRPGVGG